LMDRVDIVFTQEINDYRNIENLQIKLLDMRLIEKILKRNKLLLNAARQVECLDCDEKCLYNGIIDKIIIFDDIVVDRDILLTIYKYISRKGTIIITAADLFIHAGVLKKGTKININAYKFLLALLIFDELGLMEVVLDDKGSYKISPPAEVLKVNLEDSEILDWVNNMVHNLK
ncbi:MAG: hypothetical protein GX796_00895, partial [Clostridiaceae bacterium]|nr:hypothetical protein [Clostridiaceae bacterium]